MSYEFWLKAGIYGAVIVFYALILIFVKKKSRNLSRDLNRRIMRCERDLGRIGKDGIVTKNELLSISRKLNAAYKLSQQIAYDNDQFGYDKVRDELLNARDSVGNWKEILSESEGLMKGVEEARVHVKSALEQLKVVLENTERVYGKIR